MKKLIIAAALIAAGTFANAASIEWSSTGNYFYNGAIATEAAHDAGTFALAYLGTTGSWAWENAYNDGAIVNQGSVIYGESKGELYAKASGSYSWTYEAPGTPVNGDIFGVVFIEDGTGKMHYLANTEGTDMTASTFTIDGMGGNTYKGSFYFQDGNFQMGSEIAPEPTSGLLVLLGMAGLMLRRKRA